MDLGIPALLPTSFSDTPGTTLIPVVAIPARNEAQRLPRLLAALDAQRPWSTGPTKLLVVLVLNNTTDQSAAVVQRALPALPNLDLHLIDTTFAPNESHVGSARRLAMETASGLVGDDGVILTTDADAAPSPDWVLENLRAIANGADLVGGRIIGDPTEEALLGEGFRRRAGKYATYAALCDELANLLDPIPHDPWPRHQDHTGGSLAVRASVYRAVGGMPALSFREDLGFVSRVLRAGFSLVHPMGVSVTVSARTEGRAPGGMADCVKSWLADEEAQKPILVQDPLAVEARLLHRHALRQMKLPPLDIAHLLDEHTAASLDVSGTTPIDDAIKTISHRLDTLKGARNAA